MSSIHKAAIVFTAFAVVLISAIASFAETINYTYDEMLQLTKTQYGDGTTVEYIYDNLGNRLVKTTALPGAPANNPPISVSNPAPASAATGIVTSTTLSWTGGGDPDTSDTVVYSVYFGTSPSDLSLVATGFQASFTPEQLSLITTYYWKVVTRDSHNASTEGPVWSFTTNSVPIASFIANRTNGWAPMTVTFTDTSQYLEVNPIASWAWDFNGDGVIDSTDRNPTHIYSSWGAYTVTLTVTDAHAATTTKTMPAYITVYDGEHVAPNTTIHCVTNAPELQSALNLAQSNGKDNVIRLVQRTYRVSENNNRMFSYESAGPYRLYLMGGYTTGCSSRELNPANSILDGGNIDQGWNDGGVLYLVDWHSTAFSGFMEVNGVSIQNGKADWGGGLNIYTEAGSAALINNIIKNNTASRYGGGAYVGTDTGTVTLINNVIAHNTALYDYGGMYAEIYYGHMYLINNTIYNNTFITSGGIAGGMYIGAYYLLSVVDMHNNIIWNNPGASGSEIYLDNYWSGAGTINAYNNDFDPAKVFGTFTNSANNINADPLFVNSAAGDYHLATGSPAINAGNNSAPLLGVADFEGEVRISGATVDIGADEYHPANFSIVPESGVFGNITVNGVSSAYTFTVNNTGTTTLVIGTIGISGTDSSEFTKGFDGCSNHTVAPSSTCTVQAIFSPQSAGAKSAAFSIPSNDPTVPTFDVPLNGTGVLPLLTVYFSGTGSGMVVSTPAGIACNTNCSAPFLSGTPVTLHSEASQYSLFAGWTNGVCSGTGDCLLTTLNTDSSVTAGFDYDTAHKVLVIGGSTDYFSTIQAAYDGAADTSTIKLWASNYSESLDCNRPVTVTLQGGYDSTYSSIVGDAVLNGTLTITDGTVVADGISVQ